MYVNLCGFLSGRRNNPKLLLFSDYRKFSCFESLSKLFSASFLDQLIVQIFIPWLSPLSSLVVALVPSLSHDLSANSDTCSFYICMEAMLSPPTLSVTVVYLDTCRKKVRKGLSFSICACGSLEGSEVTTEAIVLSRGHRPWQLSVTSQVHSGVS